MSDRPTDLTRWLSAEPLAPVSVTLPSGRSVQIARFVRRDQRAPQSIEKVAPCWAPNKPAISFEGTVTWAEFVIVRLLEREGWSARWLLNWAGPRMPCGDVGRADPLPAEVASIIARIDRRAGVDSGGGAWDVVAWRDGERLFIESKQHRSSDRLSGNQGRWLGAALDEGFAAGDFAVVEYDLGVPLQPPRAARSSRSTSTTPAAAAPRGRTTRVPAPLPPDIVDLLERARNAAPNERIGYRDRIARAGAPAIRAMELWIATGIHPGFAVRVIEAAGRLELQTEARAALRRARLTAGASTQTDIDEALTRLKPRRKT